MLVHYRNIVVRLRTGISPVICVLILTAASLLAAPPFEPAVLVESYVSVSNAQQARMQGASMEIDIQAEVPKLKKRGRLHAFRRISALGRLTYDALHFEGDRSIKNEVIARYLSAEAQAFNSEDNSRSVIPANYKFHYKGLVERDGRQVHLFQVSPRKKRVGLFAGELWLDPETHLAVRESGRFVKNPSIFLKKVEFVREFEIRDGMSIPKSIQTSVDTRLVGKANLTVAYSAVSFAEPTSLPQVGERQLERFFSIRRPLKDSTAERVRAGRHPAKLSLIGIPSGCAIRPACWPTVKWSTRLPTAFPSRELWKWPRISNCSSCSPPRRVFTST